MSLLSASLRTKGPASPFFLPGSKDFKRGMNSMPLEILWLSYDLRWTDRRTEPRCHCPYHSETSSGLQAPQESMLLPGLARARFQLEWPEEALSAEGLGRIADALVDVS